MLMNLRRTMSVLAGLALAAPLATAPPAHAGILGPSGKSVEARGLFAPLSIDIANNGTAWFSQNFTGKLMRKPVDGPQKVIWHHPKGAEVGAVSAAGSGVTFAVSSQTGKSTLRVLHRGAGVTTLAHLSRYEANHNPDASETYGITGLEEGCTVRRRLRPYTGIVESHPYATAYDGGTRYVADAAANAIWGVTPSGAVSTVAVLPPQSVEITQQVADDNDLPDCAVGATANLEAVPTDVEVGHDGMLYVTSLPGELIEGGQGQVLSVDPESGDVSQVAGGLVSPTGLAIGPLGDFYVAELFANRISRIPSGGGSAQPWTSVTMPGDVSFAAGDIWATRKVLTGFSGEPPAGQVVHYIGGVPGPDTH